MRSMKKYCLGMALLSGSLLQPGCELRKPLPRAHDARPPVEMVEVKPAQLAGPGKASPATALPLQDEREPNDDREHAQQLAGNTGVRGSAAAPTTAASGKGSDDFYVFTAPAASVGAPSQPQLLQLELTGGPGVDLSLELQDATGKRLALVDERGAGEGERLPNFAVAAGQSLYFRVRGTLKGAVADQAAAAYQLSLVTQPAPPDSEAEPNDTVAQASALPGGSVSGALSFRKDEDVYLLSLPEALSRQPQPAVGTSRVGLRAAAILRVELRTPGVTPALRILLQPGDPTGAENPTAAPAPPASPAQVLDVVATKGTQELRLRNVALPAGTALAYLVIRGQSFPRPAGEARYSLRVFVESELEDAEAEPNDDCAHPMLVTLANTSGNRADGDLAGFLWPGDVDCFRLHSAAAGEHRWQVKLALPGGDCQATLETVRSSPAAAKTTPTTPGQLDVRSNEDLVFRVFSRERRTCFEAPYRLTMEQETLGSGAP